MAVYPYTMGYRSPIEPLFSGSQWPGIQNSIIPTSMFSDLRRRYKSFTSDLETIQPKSTDNQYSSYSYSSSTFDNGVDEPIKSSYEHITTHMVGKKSQNIEV